MQGASYTTYGILDPRTGLFVYVGQTSDMTRRERQHRGTHRTKTTKHPKGSIKTWLCEAHRKGIEPVFVTLELVETEEESLISESKLVDKLGRQAGHPIRNLWDEHREILAEGKNTGRYDALIFRDGAKPKRVGEAVPNTRKTGLVYELAEDMTAGTRIDFLPPKGG